MIQKISGNKNRVNERVAPPPYDSCYGDDILADIKESLFNELNEKQKELMRKGDWYPINEHRKYLTGLLRYTGELLEELDDFMEEDMGLRN